MLEQNRETDVTEGGDDEDSDACGFVPKSYTVMTLRQVMREDLLGIPNLLEHAITLFV